MSYFSSALTALASFSPQKQILVLSKHTAKTCPGPKSTIGTTKPPGESIYTSLQRRETEVYACIEGETGSPVSSQSPATKVCPGDPGAWLPLSFLLTHVCHVNLIDQRIGPPEVECPSTPQKLP